MNQAAKLTIRHKKTSGRGHLSAGPNLEVLLNGEPLPLCFGITVDIQPNSIVKATVSLYADIEVEDLEVLLEARKAVTEHPKLQAVVRSEIADILKPARAKVEILKQ